MKVRSIDILEAFEVKNLTDQVMSDLVNWVYTVNGANLFVDRHGSHVHVKGKGLEFELYPQAMPIWLVCSQGNFFAFTDEEFQRYYEPVEKQKIAARVTVQTQKEFTQGALGTIFQALINSGLTRDQALDGLVEIQKTGVRFIEQHKLAWRNSVQPRCMRCSMEQVQRYGVSNHETAEHDAWVALHLNKETNPDA